MKEPNATTVKISRGTKDASHFVISSGEFSCEIDNIQDAGRILAGLRIPYPDIERLLVAIGSGERNFVTIDMRGIVKV